MTDHTEPTVLPFTYEEFADWYSAIWKNLLEPGRATLVRLLGELIDQSVSELDKHRVRMKDSRVKETLRLWSKIQKDKYRPLIHSLDDIPTVIDDLVGVRIVCNNLSDVRFVRDLLSDWPAPEAMGQFGMAVEFTSERQYIEDPKDSGYRGYHINLVTNVPGLKDTHRVRGELQVRTLLQDGWGELTHEDTYKPGVELPAQVTSLSRKMADLLANVDDLAQDLRLELDRLAQSAVEDAPVSEPDDETTAAAGESDTDASEGPEPSRKLVLQETARIVSKLRNPATLATIAATLQATFGTKVRRNWVGYGSFKKMLMAAVPEVTIHHPAPGYVIPAGAKPGAHWPRQLRDAPPPTEPGPSKP
jgi:ppGpp synthetase/RelA/SpoT-type nucleotidyltranferase